VVANKLTDFFVGSMKYTADDLDEEDFVESTVIKDDISEDDSLHNAKLAAKVAISYIPDADECRAVNYDINQALYNKM